MLKVEHSSLVSDIFIHSLVELLCKLLKKSATSLSFGIRVIAASMRCTQRDAGSFPPNDLWNHLLFESGFAHLTSGRTDTTNTCNRSPTAKRKFNDITRKPLQFCSHKETGVLFLLYCD